MNNSFLEEINGLLRAAEERNRKYKSSRNLTTLIYIIAN